MSERLTVEAERDLIRRLQQGDADAEAQLIAANMPFVYKTIRDGKWRRIAPAEDLAQAGALGLLLAARRFDLSRDTRFLTYAGYYIWLGFRDLVRQSLRSRDTISYEGAHADQSAVEGETAWLESQEEVEHLLNCLSEQQLRVVALYYGLSGQPHSMEDIASLLGVTQQYVSILHRQALDRMRTTAGVRMPYRPDLLQLPKSPRKTARNGTATQRNTDRETGSGDSRAA